jgi:hypothetical protein
MARAQQQLADAAAPAKEIQEAAEEEQRAAEEARRKAEAQAAAEYRAKRAADADASFQGFMKLWSDNTNPRPYEKAIQKTEIDGNTFVIRLSINSRSEATSLCNFTLNGWSERGRFGIMEIKVTDLDGAVLSESMHLSTGAHVCR